MVLRPNKPYLAFVALISTGAFALIGGLLTAQVYGQWSRGLPITGGFSWPLVFGIDALCFLGALAVYWKIYADSKATIDSSGVRRLSLGGWQRIEWREVTAVKVFGGVGVHIHAGRRKIVVTPYAYHEPEAVMETLRRHLSERKNGSAA